MQSGGTRGSALKALLIAAVLLGSVPAASASAVTEVLGGEWSGSGTIRLANGKSERIRCRGKADAGDAMVHQYFSCASTGGSFSFSTSLKFAGNQVSGDWRGPDLSGSLSGRATTGSISLRLVSDTGTGNLRATLSRCAQSLTVTGWSEAMRSLSVRLKKSC
jgi:hypothetical protein